MLYLLLTIFCSLTISLILKFSEGRGGTRTILAGANYVAATILASILAPDLTLPIRPIWTIFVVAVGIGFTAGFLVQMWAIKELGLAVPISVARIATLGPVVGSVIFYEERPSMLQIFGIGIGLASFAALGLAQRNQRDPGAQAQYDFRGIGIIALVFGLMALNDFSMKVAEESGQDQSTLLFYIFATASVATWIWIGIRHVLIQGRDLLLGAALGVPNYFSSYFLILALEELGASKVFPIASAAGVILTTLAALLIWKERPNNIAWIGIALAAAAVALLGMGYE